jgi:hypothetical protein
MKEETRQTPWFVTFSGMKFFPAEPEPHEILLMDVSHALSQTNRFGGHTVRPYSVAAHSLLVAELLPAHLKLQGLMHDAAEAFMGDVISPIKQLLPEVKALEKIIWRAIADRFGLPCVLDPLVKRADLYALRLERDKLIRNSFHWPIDDDSFPEWPGANRSPVPEFVNAEAAELAFSRYFFQLSPEFFKSSKPTNTNTNTNTNL